MNIRNKAIAAVVLLFAFVLCLSGVTGMAGNVKAAGKEEAHDVRLVDNAGLLSESEYGRILLSLDQISDRHQFELVIVTEESIGGSAARDYADDYFGISLRGT